MLGMALSLVGDKSFTPVRDALDVGPGAVRTVRRSALERVVNDRVLDDLAHLQRSSMLMLELDRADEDAGIVSPDVPREPEPADCFQ
jgi:hypothetical protein